MDEGHGITGSSGLLRVYSSASPNSRIGELDSGQAQRGAIRREALKSGYKEGQARKGLGKERP
jgi:hypothetical protein